MLADLPYVVRMLRRSPGFAAVAVVSIALGVGANTIVFSVVNALLLRPLPVSHPEAVVFVQNANREFPSQSYPNYRDLRDRNDVFSGLIGYRISPMNVETAGGATRVWGYLATGNYFNVLGIRPAAGRLFDEGDDGLPGASPFAVLSHDFWIARFGSDPQVVGTTVRINRLPYTIIGVASRGFRGTERFYQPALWVPMMMQPHIEIGNPWLDRRMTFNVWMAGRLKPGVSVARAEANLNAVAAELAREHPAINEGWRLKLASPGLIGDALGAPVRMFTLGVLALAGLVLIAACANLANLLLARAADRQREMAIRISIGAGRARLARQLLTESLVLSLAGGLAGVIIATFASRALSAWRAPLEFPVQFDVQPDWRVFLFAFAILPHDWCATPRRPRARVGRPSRRASGGCRQRSVRATDPSDQRRRGQAVPIWQRPAGRGNWSHPGRQVPVTDRGPPGRVSIDSAVVQLHHDAARPVSGPARDDDCCDPTIHCGARSAIAASWSRNPRRNAGIRILPGSRGRNSAQRVRTAGDRTIGDGNPRSGCVCSRST